MTPPKTARNARIVRLRDFSYDLKIDGPVSWAWIAERIAVEFPDDPPITRQRAQQIYRAETK